MITMILDTGLFSVPPYADSEDAITAMIERILHWHDVILKKYPIRLFKHSDAERALSSHNCWPIEKDLNTLLTQYDLNEVFSVNDIARIYNSLLSRLEVLSEYGIEAASCSSISIEPNVFENHSPSGLVEHSKTVYASHCLNRIYLSRKSYIVSGICHEGGIQLGVSGLVTKVAGMESISVSVPLTLNSHAFLVDRIDSVTFHSESIDIWNCSKNNSDIYLAILIRCMEILSNCGGSAAFTDIPKFSVGKDFFDSLRKFQSAPQQYYSNSTFEACCRVVLRQTNQTLRPMGKPKQKIRMDDNATAWRTHITKKHEALRLMIWSSNNIIELANVGSKGELYISNATSDEAFSIEI